MNNFSVINSVAENCIWPESCVLSTGCSPFSPSAYPKVCSNRHWVLQLDMTHHTEAESVPVALYWESFLSQHVSTVNSGWVGGDCVHLPLWPGICLVWACTGLIYAVSLWFHGSMVFVCFFVFVILVGWLSFWKVRRFWKRLRQRKNIMKIYEK